MGVHQEQGGCKASRTRPRPYKEKKKKKKKISAFFLPQGIKDVPPTSQ